MVSILHILQPKFSMHFHSFPRVPLTQRILFFMI